MDPSSSEPAGGACHARRSAHRLPSSAWAEIEQHYLVCELSVRQIAERFGVSERAIEARVSRWNWPRRRDLRADAATLARARLQRIVGHKLLVLEARKGEVQTLSPADSERHSRDVASLVSSIDRMDRMNRDARAPVRGRPTVSRRNVGPAPALSPAPDGDDDDRYWRDELKRRIAALRASRGL